MNDRRPLSGILVVDLSRVLAGPYCTMLLAELGARVIKVEHPEGGDDARAYGPFIASKSAYFTSINRGKESIALDLKVERDRQVFEAMIKRADVLVENFRPGTMERLGYGWDQVRKRNPAIVYLSASGFGQTGPHANRPAYDMVVQGLGGMMSVTGHPNSPPARVGMSIGDIGAGLYAAVAVNAALVKRASTGEGSRVDIAMFDCQLALLENAIMRYLATGEVPGPLGSRHPAITPFQAFQARDGAMIIAAGNDALFQKLCRVLEAPEIAADDRFASNDLRCRNHQALVARIETILQAHPSSYWIERLDHAGIPAGPINTVAQAVEHPQIAARNMVVSVLDPLMGSVKVVGNPIKFHGLPDPPYRQSAPDLDQHRYEILQELMTQGELV